MLPGLFRSGAYRSPASVSRRTTDGSRRGRPSLLCRPWPARRPAACHESGKLSFWACHMWGHIVHADFAQTTALYVVG